MKNKELLWRFILGISLLFFSFLVIFFLRENTGFLIFFNLFIISLFIVFLLWFYPNKKIEMHSTPMYSHHVQDSFVIQKLIDHIDRAFFVLLPSGNVMISSALQESLFGRVWNNLEDIQSFPTLWGSLQQSLAIETGATIEWDFDKKRIQSRIIPLQFESTFFGLFVLSIDITHQHNLDQIQTEFLADISHELKTPLAAIIGATDILNRPNTKLSPKDRQSFLDIIDKESSRMQRLIDELTNLSRLDNKLFSSLIKSEFWFDSLLEDVIQVHTPTLNDKGLSVSVHSSCHTLVFLDRDKAFQIFSNLLSNAIRYTHRGGIYVSCDIVNKFTVITFKDSGAGIEPQNLSRIFDRFYRTDFARNRVEGGSGLGLAITRAIIEAHKGTIEVKSVLGEGTTFVISLPNLN